jgi:uncharacterized membrane protein YfcA
MELFGYFSAVLIGISLGLIGGGGSALAIPVLVYLFHLSPQSAIPDSFFIVGLSSFAGAMSYLYSRMISYKSALIFGFPSILSVYYTHRYVLPAIPDQLGLSGNLVVSKDMFVLIIFATLMIAASLSMITSKRREKKEKKAEEEKSYPYLQMMLSGICIGFLAGLVGAGGGFLIIPALILLAKLPMKTAIGTSLLIIAINSGIGFVSHLQGNSHTDWAFLSLFGSLSVTGIFLGKHISKFISGDALKPAFGWFVLAIGAFIISQQIIKIH